MRSNLITCSLAYVLIVTTKIIMKKSFLALILVLVCSNLSSQKLFKAVDKGDAQKVKALLEKGADPNVYTEDGLFPLWRATANNNQEITKLLLENGATVDLENKTSSGSLTSLIYPSQEGYFEIVKLLVDHGADINYNAFKGFTPIRIAARNGHLNIIKYLAEHGAKIDVKAEDGATPLEHAASKGHYDVVRFLIDKGANVNTVDKEGDFPLGEAAKYGYTEIMELLIRNKADLSLKNASGKTALDLAKERGQKRAVDLLKNQ